MRSGLWRWRSGRPPAAACTLVGGGAGASMARLSLFVATSAGPSVRQASCRAEPTLVLGMCPGSSSLRPGPGPAPMWPHVWDPPRGLGLLLGLAAWGPVLCLPPLCLKQSHQHSRRAARESTALLRNGKTKDLGRLSLWVPMPSQTPSLQGSRAPVWGSSCPAARQVRGYPQAWLGSPPGCHQLRAEQRRGH